jgi:cytidylate kinase
MAEEAPPKAPVNAPVIAIDGPSGVGKTTISRLVAEALGYRYVDTGAMYRAVAVAADAAGVGPDDETALKAFCDAATINFTEGGAVRVDGKDLTKEIRERSAGPLASLYSSKTVVREFLVAVQRRLGAGGGVVMEGRDIGTVVFPAAEVKIFLDASAGERARRRHGELMEKSGETGRDPGAIDIAIDVEEVEKDLAERDLRDATRENSPLRCAEDAVRIDTDGLGKEAVAEAILDVVKERTKNKVK